MGVFARQAGPMTKSSLGFHRRRPHGVGGLLRSAAGMGPADDTVGLPALRQRPRPIAPGILCLPVASASCSAARRGADRLRPRADPRDLLQLCDYADHEGRLRLPVSSIPTTTPIRGPVNVFAGRFHTAF